MSIEEIDVEIARLKEEYHAVKGTTCECYQRIVGYMRNINNWNKGKRAEYGERKNFLVPTPT
jgi:anaerobic ribonucleoside-triphosphate reductase